MLDAVPAADPYVFLTKTVDQYRVHLFDIVTQYKVGGTRASE